MQLFLVICVALCASMIGVEARKKIPKGQRPATGEVPQSPEKRKFQPKFVHTVSHLRAAVPDTFDARKQWPKCKSIADIRDQSGCGTCWAVSTASVMSDRFCIESKGVVQDYISSAQIAGCAFPDKTPSANCHTGGSMTMGYERATLYGVPTGGNYNDSSKVDGGCQPYTVPPGGSVDITCEAECWNDKYPKKTVKEDLRFIDSYVIMESPNSVLDQAKITENIAAMKKELVANGPITVRIDCWTDFQEWEPKDGLYCSPAKDAESMGGHAVRIIGWNKTKDNKYYWMISNSWGTKFGDKGIFWVEMGKNCIGIESFMSAPVIKMPNTCGKLCDQPVDMVIRMPPTDPNGKLFAFQGNCTQEVAIGPKGKFLPKGKLVPIAQQFLASVPGPITRWMKTEDKTTWFMNEKMGAGCKPVEGSTKHQCYSAPTNLDDTPTTHAFNGYTYNYYRSPPEKLSMLYGWTNDNSPNNQHNKIGTLFTDAFKKVNSLLDIGGTKMQVCGLDKAGKGVCGMLSYKDFTKWQFPPGPQCV